MHTACVDHIEYKLKRVHLLFAEMFHSEKQNQPAAAEEHNIFHGIS